MSAHGLYVLAAYSASALGVGGLALWVLVRARAQARTLVLLEAAGARRRSERRA